MPFYTVFDAGTKDQEVDVSKVTAIHFIHKVGGDPALQQQIVAVEGNMAGLLGIAAKAGFNFTGEDWNSAVIELADSMMGELSDEELNNVAGGGGTLTPPGTNSFSWGGSFLPPHVSLYYYTPG